MDHEHRKRKTRAAASRDPMPPDIRQAQFSGFVPRGVSASDLIEEMKGLTWTQGVEFAVVSLADGRRAVVRGGPGGIAFSYREAPERGIDLYLDIEGNETRVARLLGHTHPKATGASHHDIEMLERLGQTRSYIFEINGDPHGTLVRPKRRGPRHPRD